MSKKVSEEVNPSFGKKCSITVRERVSPDLLARLLAHDKIDRDHYYNSIMRYWHMQNTSKGAGVEVRFVPKKGFNEGRLFCDGFSMQSLWTPHRDALIGNTYVDIDMVNAGPTILLQYCKKNNINLINDSLEKYVTDRERILMLIMTRFSIPRSDAKSLIIKVLYGGDYHSVKDRHDKTKIKYEFDFDSKYLDQLTKLIRSISKSIKSKETELFKFIKKSNPDKDESSLTRKLVSYCVQRVECSALKAMVNYARSTNVEVGTLMFDGMLLLRESFNVSEDEELDIEEYLLDMTEYVKKKTGYKVKLTHKPASTDLRLPEFTFCVKDDREAAQKLLQICGSNKFVECDNTLIIFNEEEGMFNHFSSCASVPPLLFRYISNNRDYFNTVKVKKDGTLTLGPNYGDSEKNAKKLLLPLRSLVIDNRWVKRTELSSIGKILFNNGIYDMGKGEFTEQFTPDYVFYDTTDNDFVPRTEENSDYIDECIEYANELSFLSIFDSEKEAAPLKKAIAKAIYGDTSGREIYFLAGPTKAGKTQLMKMIERCFGGFVTAFSPENLAYNTKSGSDEAMKNKWIYESRFKRLLTASEPQMLQDFSGNTIKKVAGGGEGIEARGLYRKAEYVVPAFTLFLCLNDTPRILNCDAAVQDRVRFVEFKNSFVPTPDPSMKFQKLADPDLNKKIKTKKFRIGFTHLIFDAYRYFKENPSPDHECDPLVMRQYLESSIVDDPSILAVRMFNFTNEFRNDKMVAAELEAYRKKFYEKTSSSAFIRTLKQLGARPYRTAKQRNAGLSGISVNRVELDAIVQEIRERDQEFVLDF